MTVFAAAADGYRTNADKQHRPRDPPIHGGGCARCGGNRSICLLLARVCGRPGPWRERDHRPAGVGDDRRSRLRQLDGGAVRGTAPRPGPSLARWLLGVGIAATLTANMAQGWSHGPVGAVVAAWPAVSLVGSYELLVWLIRMSGTAEHRPPAGHLGDAAACRAVARSATTAATGAEFPRRGERDTPDHERQPAAQVAGPQPSPPAGSVTRRYLRPTPSMTPRWPHTGGAPTPAIRSPNASSPRCSDAHPAAGRAPESPKRGEPRLQGSGGSGNHCRRLIPVAPRAKNRRSGRF